MRVFTSPSYDVHFLVSVVFESITSPCNLKLLHKLLKQTTGKVFLQLMTGPLVKGLVKGLFKGRQKELVINLYTTPILVTIEMILLQVN